MGPRAEPGGSERLEGSPGEILADPISGRRVVFAPERGGRPGASARAREPADASELETCPFCEGREARTPPELFALGGEPERDPDTPGWRVRVVPNLYPAFAHQLVVVHHPQHVRFLAELEPDQLDLVVSAWAEGAERAWSAGFDHMLAFVNEGKTAGASLPHSHSQLIWLREPPPEIVAEQARLDKADCALCRLLKGLSPELRLAEREGGKVSLAVSPTGRAPYELLIAPSEHLPDAFGAPDQLRAALELAAEGTRRLGAAEGSAPFNLWLHSFQKNGHWHLELVPRLSVFAGIELGGGIYVNTLRPETAAERLRSTGLAD
jgi:UDPglucose--hexose-1-phosphate uridylyltransferase